MYVAYPSPEQSAKAIPAVESEESPLAASVSTATPTVASEVASEPAPAGPHSVRQSLEPTGEDRARADRDDGSDADPRPGDGLEERDLVEGDSDTCDEYEPQRPAATPPSGNQSETCK